MKTIQKITLSLLTVAAFSSLNAAADFHFTDGATLEGNTTGSLNFIGAASNNNLVLSGSISADADLQVGNVKIAANTVAGSIKMDGGALETTAAVDLPRMVMTQDGTIVLGGACAMSASGTAKATVSGAPKLELDAAAGPVDHLDGPTHLVAASALAATSAYNFGALILDAAIPAAIGGVVAASSVDATAGNVAAAVFNSLTTMSLSIAGNTFSQDIIVG